MIDQQGAHRAGIAVQARANVLQMLLGEGFVHGASHPEYDDGREATDTEGDTPTPGGDLVVGQRCGLDEQDGLGDDLATNEGDVLEG